jgi:hypothetical protein
MSFSEEESMTLDFADHIPAIIEGGGIFCKPFGYVQFPIR